MRSIDRIGWRHAPPGIDRSCTKALRSAGTAMTKYWEVDAQHRPNRVETPGIEQHSKNINLDESGETEKHLPIASSPIDARFLWFHVSLDARQERPHRRAPPKACPGRRGRPPSGRCRIRDCEHGAAELRLICDCYMDRLLPEERARLEEAWALWDSEDYEHLTRGVATVIDAVIRHQRREASLVDVDRTSAY